jgi:formylglycine-generating enzyme
MTTPCAPRWTAVSLLSASMVGAGCGGSPFETTAGLVQSGDAAQIAQDADSHDAAGGADSGNPSDGSKPTLDAAEEAQVASACGSLRTSDAPSFSRETCIEGASFSMGSNTANLGDAFADHTPAHHVSLSAFVIDAYEVTVGRYRSCVEEGHCTPPPTAAASTWSASAAASEALPITGVTWQDAATFCGWDGGRGLPTEAQWEYVARGPATTSFPWGDEFSCSRAVLGGYSGGPCAEYLGVQPKPVGSLLPQDSPMMAFDIIGNVAEWVADYAGSYPPGATTDPTGPSIGAMKIVRGGSWANGLAFGYGFSRATAPAEMRGPWGFRCARKP